MSYLILLLRVRDRLGHCVYDVPSVRRAPSLPPVLVHESSELLDLLLLRLLLLLLLSQKLLLLFDLVGQSGKLAGRVDTKVSSTGRI